MANTSIKEYYVNLQKLYNETVAILTAVNQSLSTTASEISLNIGNADGQTSTTIRIPSFLYLESKIEELSTNFSELYNMPKSGEAWFHNVNDMFKVKMVQSNTAPVTPNIISNSDLTATFKKNLKLKDFVSPKTYLRFDISNLSDNIDKFYVKKLVMYNYEDYQAIIDSGYTSYEDISSNLKSLSNANQYEEYDSIIEAPLKKDKYISSFKILDIPTLEGSTNPYYNSELNYETSTIDDVKKAHTDNHLIYQLTVDTLQYHSEEDLSNSHELKIGDELTLINNYAIYTIKAIDKVKSLNDDSFRYTLTIEEKFGHIALQTYEENQNMVLKLYKRNYNEYHYIEVPLEENPYIILFISTIYNNIRSKFSDCIPVNLNSVYMVDNDGNKIIDPNTNKAVTYIEYYNKYCTNIGDILTGMSDVIYPQITSFSNSTIEDIQESDTIKNFVSNVFLDESPLVVTRINGHIIDTKLKDQIISANSQKAKVSQELTNIQSQIDEKYNTLLNTDFSTDLTVDRVELQTSLNKLYAERKQLNKEYYNSVNLINTYKSQGGNLIDSKYRIRGVLHTESIEKYLHENLSPLIEIIGMDLEYKYVSQSSETEEITSSKNDIYTNWNKYTSIDKERFIKIEGNNLVIQNNNYDAISNVIKWNQVDISISPNETVILRVRFKYNIGQPFINLYSPWSEEYNIEFPESFNESEDLTSIFDNNDADLSNAKFINELVSQGYDDHISNKLIDNQAVFYHLPENIYSGFNTSDNSLISLKDKLIDMCKQLDSYKELLLGYTSSEYKVYLVMNDRNIELKQDSFQQINYRTDLNITNEIISNKFTIVIKNTGGSNIKLYSLFSGNQSDSLYDVNSRQYTLLGIENYDKVLLLDDDSTDNSEDREDVIREQKLGQYIYFRCNDPYKLNPTSTIPGLLNVYDGDYYKVKDTDYTDIKEETTKTNKIIDYLSNNTLNGITYPEKVNYIITVLNNFYKNNTLALDNPELLKLLNPNQIIKDIQDLDNKDTSAEDTSTEDTSIENTPTSTEDTSTEETPVIDEPIEDTSDSETQEDKEIDIFGLKKYDKIIGENRDKSYYHNYIVKLHSLSIKEQNEIISSKKSLAIITPSITEEQLLCDQSDIYNNLQYKQLAPGESISIPLLFEYIFPSANTDDNTIEISESGNKTMSRSIYFDLKTSISLADSVSHYGFKLNIITN